MCPLRPSLSRAQALVSRPRVRGRRRQWAAGRARKLWAWQACGNDFIGKACNIFPVACGWRRLAVGLRWGSLLQPTRGQRRSHCCPEQAHARCRSAPFSGPGQKGHGGQSQGWGEEPPVAAPKPYRPGTGFAPSSPPARLLTMIPWACFLLAGVSTSNSSAACSGL